MKRKDRPYHHGNLAESLLSAADEIAGKFGLEAVTLRGCAKLVGVSPSSAFRHYSDKRALMTALAARALKLLTDTLASAHAEARQQNSDAFVSVGLAYVAFALEKPAYFRAMWREEAIYSQNEEYVAAANGLRAHLQSGFADTLDDLDPHTLSTDEFMAWSVVHGMAQLYIDGPVANADNDESKLASARQVLQTLKTAF